MPHCATTYVIRDHIGVARWGIVLPGTCTWHRAATFARAVFKDAMRPSDLEALTGLPAVASSRKKPVGY